MRAWGEVALDVSAQLARVFASLGHASVRVAGDLGPVGAFVGGAILLDVTIVVALVVGFTIVRPRIAERLRS